MKSKMNILLFGATGFLGCHLLKALLDYDYKVYCLIRGDDVEQSREKLSRVFNYYFNESFRLYRDRIIIICGDITEDKFGMLSNEYYALGNNIEIIIHCAALVKHFASKDLFENVNVKGTERILNFAHHYNIYTVLISSIAVTKLDIVHPAYGDFQEKNYILRQEDEVNAYTKSKIEAEKIFSKAQKQGLRGMVIRVGTLTGRYSDGGFQINMEENALYCRLNTILKSGILPRILKTNHIEFTPVDLCCDAILKLIRTGVCDYYHVCNPHTITYEKLCDYLSKLSVQIRYENIETLNEYLDVINGKVSGRTLITGFYVFFKRNSNYVYSRENLICDYTSTVLKNLNFEWPKIDFCYIHKILNNSFSVR